MGFDEDVDAARERLVAALQAETARPEFDDEAQLHALLPLLTSRLASRRLAFSLDQEESDFWIAILHRPSGEDLGYIMVEDGEYVFESNLEDYFEDFIDEDRESFLNRLYETLRADLAKYEFDQEQG